MEEKLTKVSKYKVKTVRWLDKFYFNWTGKQPEASVNVYCYEIMREKKDNIVYVNYQHRGGGGGEGAGMW